MRPRHKFLLIFRLPFQEKDAFHRVRSQRIRRQRKDRHNPLRSNRLRLEPRHFRHQNNNLWSNLRWSHRSSDLGSRPDHPWMSPNHPKWYPSHPLYLRTLCSEFDPLYHVDQKTRVGKCWEPHSETLFQEKRCCTHLNFYLSFVVRRGQSVKQEHPQSCLENLSTQVPQSQPLRRGIQHYLG